jgi:hypothetical protein
MAEKEHPEVPLAARTPRKPMVTVMAKAGKRIRILPYGSY